LRPNDAKAQITNVRFAPVAHILSRCRAPRIAPSWREMLHSLREKTPQREACIAGGYIATRLTDGKSVRFKRMK
jgi:hypothetical protein